MVKTTNKQNNHQSYEKHNIYTLPRTIYSERLVQIDPFILKILSIDERERPQLLGLYDLCWIGAVKKYLESIALSEFVYERLFDPTENWQSTNDIVHER